MRIAIEIKLTTAERKTLQIWARSRSVPKRQAERAQIVLLAAKGKTSGDIADELGIKPHTVGRWRNRFAEHRIDGIKKDLPRGGRPRTPACGHERARKSQRPQRVRQPQRGIPRLPPPGVDHVACRSGDEGRRRDDAERQALVRSQDDATSILHAAPVVHEQDIRDRTSQGVDVAPSRRHGTPPTVNEEGRGEKEIGIAILIEVGGDDVTEAPAAGADEVLDARRKGARAIGAEHREATPVDRDEIVVAIQIEVRHPQTERTAEADVDALLLQEGAGSVPDEKTHRS